jgi:hypothetical protein
MCPGCGRLQRTPTERKRHRWSLAILILASAAILLGWRYYFPT